MVSYAKDCLLWMPLVLTSHDLPVTPLGSDIAKRVEEVRGS